MDVKNVKANLQIIGTRIRKLDIENSYVFVELSDESINRELDLHYEIGDTFETEDNTLAMTLIMDIEAVIYDEEDRMKVSIEIDGGFYIENSVDKELLEKMVTVNGSAALYSIARGIISSITSQVCTNGTVVLPMVNMFDLKEQMSEDNIEK